MAYTVLKWEIPDPDLHMSAGWDSMLVQREDGAAWTTITRGTIFIPLVSGMTEYLFNDPRGDASKDYRVQLYNRTTGSTSLFGSISDREDIELYAGLADLRSEGYNDPPYSDAQLERALAWAREFVEKATRNWFNPRYRVVKLDGRRNRAGDEGMGFNLPHPIIAAMEVEVDGTEIEREGFATYNRHLTDGISVPSDPSNPRLVFNDIIEYPFHRRHLPIESWFGEAQWVVIRGLWGWTELGFDDEIGETEEESGIPLSYGGTPSLIKRATLKLAGLFADKIESASGSAGAGPVVQEKTRDQSYKRQEASDSVLGDGVTGDPELDAILRGFRNVRSLVGSV